jgi:AraC-like DNA-binding protein
MLDTYEISLLEAIYTADRIPLWIYGSELNLTNYFFAKTADNINKTLQEYMSTVIRKAPYLDFDLLYYNNELYYIFSFDHKKERCFCLGGPMLLTGIYPPTAVKSLSFSSKLNMKELENLVDLLPIISFTHFSSYLRITMLILKREALSLDEINNFKITSLHDSLKRSFIFELFENREDGRVHTSYSQELTVLNYIKEGDLKRLESTYRSLPQIKYGKMSDNPIRQLFYGCIANTTLVTRYAIEGGLEEEVAFTLSDVYIQKMEKCKTLYELHLLNEKMAVDFTEHVAKAKEGKHPAYLEPINKCIEMIYKNLHQRITLNMLAIEVHLTPKYLSHLFHKETGQTLTEFIEAKRIEEAKNLLIYSQYSYSKISTYLCFNSHSYFISVFKKRVGITPKEYRIKYTMPTWRVT